MASTLWIDIEDLLWYARMYARPSGIQRVTFELARAIHARSGSTGATGSGAVRFVRHDPLRGSFRTVDWRELEARFGALTDGREPTVAGAVPGSSQPVPRSGGLGFRRMLKQALFRVPEEPRLHLTTALLAQQASLRAWAPVFGDLGHGLLRTVRTLLPGRRAPPGADGQAPETASSLLGDVAQPGDTLLTLGAFWSRPGYAAMIREHRQRLGLRYALLVYDIIAVRRPEWCEPAFVQAFRSFFDPMLPLCDAVLAISRATAEDVARYAHQRNISLAGAVRPIPMGSGFGDMPGAAAPTDRLPPPGTYALFVSTMEVRKNHLLIFRVWRRLLDELPPGQVPAMVFAGRVGWLVADLMREIANSNHLDGKLIVLEHPSDTELAALYRGCRFTVFPSFYEGWGLPVTESLAFGKPCLIADRTSLPEAGGSLARRFDPDNLNDAFAAIRDVILDPRGLAEWEDRVRREFRPVPWTVGAEALLAALGYAVTAPEVREGALPELAAAETDRLP